LRPAPDCRPRRALLHLSYSSALSYSDSAFVTHAPQPTFDCRAGLFQSPPNPDFDRRARKSRAADLRRTLAFTCSQSVSRALISASRGWGAVASRASVKVRKADNDGQTREEARPDAGKSAGFRASAQPTGCFDCQPRTLRAIYRCRRQRKERPWPQPSGMRGMSGKTTRLKGFNVADRLFTD